MSMKKAAIWLGKMAAAALLVSFLSIWTTGYIVTSYVEALLKQFHIPLQVQPLTMGGVWGQLWGAEPGVQDSVPVTAPAENSQEEPTASSPPPTEEQQSNSATNGVGENEGAVESGSETEGMNGSNLQPGAPGSASEGGLNDGGIGTESDGGGLPGDADEQPAASPFNSDPQASNEGAAENGGINRSLPDEDSSGTSLPTPSPGLEEDGISLQGDPRNI